jgi:hypothetical protein
MLEADGAERRPARVTTTTGLDQAWDLGGQSFGSSLANAISLRTAARAFIFRGHAAQVLDLWDMRAVPRRPSQALVVLRRGGLRGRGVPPGRDGRIVFAWAGVVDVDWELYTIRSERHGGCAS